jgi:hypothetical protein
VNRDFIQIKSLQGELKIAHKLRDLGLTVSTEEFVIQKPHVNYHILLDNIVSIVPYESEIRDYQYVNRRDNDEEVTRPQAGLHLFKVHVTATTMHNRSGIFPLQQMDFIIPIHEDILSAIGRYSEMKAIK